MEFFMFDEETTVDDQPVITRAGDVEHEFKVEIGFLELEVVAFTGAVKIVGYAHFGISGRATSRRASDYIRHFNDTKLTLSKASVYQAATGELIETVPFAVLNLDRVDLIYARDIEPGGDGASRPGPADLS